MSVFLSPPNNIYGLFCVSGLTRHPTRGKRVLLRECTMARVRGERVRAQVRSGFAGVLPAANAGSGPCRFESSPRPTATHVNAALNGMYRCMIHSFHGGTMGGITLSEDSKCPQWH